MRVGPQSLNAGTVAPCGSISKPAAMFEAKLVVRAVARPCFFFLSVVAVVVQTKLCGTYAIGRLFSEQVVVHPCFFLSVAEQSNLFGIKLDCQIVR